MWKAREDGYTIQVRYGKILFCGANGAGKTNFSNLLLKEEFSHKHISTEVIKPQQATIAIKAQVSKHDENSEVIFEKMDIDQEISQLMSYLPKKYTKPQHQEDTTPYDQQDTTSYNQKHALKVQRKHKTSKIVWPLKLFSKKNKNKVSTFTEDAMSRKIVSTSIYSKSHVAQQHKKVRDILTFMDTGGQPQYICVLPAVNSFAMITFIVHKMKGGRESLDDKFMVQHGNKEGKHSFTPYEHECTYLHLIKTLMSYASVNFFPDKSFLNEFKISCNQTHSRSISFIGTHSKDVSENDIVEIDRVLTDIVETSNSKNIKVKLNEIYNCLIPIDNKEQNSLPEICPKSKDLESPVSSEEYDAKRYTNPSTIREYIYEWMEKQDIYEVPIQWLLLELEVRKVCESKQCSFITCEDVLQIGREKSLGDDNFIKIGLRFHHIFGVLLYFEEVEGMHELVITNHKWLFEKLSEIVKYSFKADIKLEYDDLHKGIFNESMLNKLNIDEDFKKSGINIKSVNPKNAFLKLLQHLLIIALLNEDDTKYFMPSLLKSLNISDHKNSIPGESNFTSLTNDPEPLLIQFESVDATNSFPRGFLCFLVVQLIDSTKWELYKRNAYNNILTFFKVNDGYYVTLVDKVFFLEIIVTHDDTDMAPIHHKVLQTIERAISAVTQRLNIEIKLKYGFLCKMCQEAKEVHMTYLVESNCNSCYCVSEKVTKLENSHKVWLSASSKVRKYI